MSYSFAFNLNFSFNIGVHSVEHHIDARFMCVNNLELGNEDLHGTSVTGSENRHQQLICFFFYFIIFLNILIGRTVPKHIFRFAYFGFGLQIKVGVIWWEVPHQTYHSLTWGPEIVCRMIFGYVPRLSTM